MKIGIAGSKDSNDCLVTVKENKGIRIEIDSAVAAFFYDQIKSTIENTLDELGITDIAVSVEDKGALDYTIKSRLISAIKRMKDNV